ncbi:MAG: response regulator [Proteobacteria bacterium]|nr:response regulator [Pseudomonadota bacterium]
MQKALLRQLKRTIGIEDEAALTLLLEKLHAAASSAETDSAGLFNGLRELLERIDASYEQYERDLQLRTRSLEISSRELSALNDQLRQELLARENALISLRDAVRVLLPNTAAGNDSIILAEADLGALSQRLADLVAESETSRRALTNQKFALDQHAIVSITDTAGNIIYANDRFCQISEFSRQQLLGQNHRIINSGLHSAEFFRDMWQTISQGRVWHGELRNRSKSGKLYWVNATVVPFPGEDGLPEQYISIRTDITDRKQMEAQLSEQLHLVEELVEAIPLPMYLKDAEGRYLRLNRAFELFFNLRREDFIGRTLHDLLSPQDAAVHLVKDRELMRKPGTQTYEAVVHGRDGVRHEAIYRKAALTQLDGTVYGVLGVIIDITERKLAERETLLAKEAAEAASRAKSEFLANMSHEIRTPMNGIIGMTDLALDTALTDEQREYMAAVKSSADSLLTIINDILDFSKIEAGKLLVEHISFDLHRLLAETLKPLALRAYEKNIEIVCEILPAVPSHVFGDPGRIRQVLINLIGNAIKFTEQGEIDLRVSLQEPADNPARVHFAVRDTGIGIAPEKQQLIFDAFSQEDSSTTRKYGGTGLGLSISRRLVDLMGGEMWLESEIDRGSTFHFAIPLQIDEFPPQARPAQIKMRGHRILIVDDNETNRRVLAGMLEAWEIIPTLAASGQMALELLQKNETAFDCILLDAHMPELDGYQLAARLRRSFATLPPMLMLSSGAMRGDAQRCQEVGIAGFFSKPIAAEELLAALCRIFDSTRNHQPLPADRLVTRHSLRELQPALDVLLVEDHPLNQKLAVSLLEKWGHRTTIANNGQEAVVRYAERSFDVILMDMQMPVMSGIEATRRIRHYEKQSALPHTPIIAMTANAMQSDRDACLAAGMDDYLAKPISAKELLEKLLTCGAPALAPATPIARFDYGEALRLADREMVDMIAGVFLDTWEHNIQRLRDGLANNDSRPIARTAQCLHRLLITFKAEPAARLAGEIEGQARLGQLAELAPSIDQLAGEIDQLAGLLSALADYP